MPLLPIEQADLSQVRLIATDLDGTLTRQGRFSSQLLQTLEQLAEHKIYVVIVTGRAAGWIDAIRTYLPVAGAIAENGGLYFPGFEAHPQILTPITNLVAHRQALAETFQDLKTFFPQLQESWDNSFRLTDWTFDVQGLTLAELDNINQICQEKNWSFTYSNVQCHIKPLEQNKAISLLTVLETYFTDLKLHQVITVGDSINDESLFEPNSFPLSVGVSNIYHYLDRLKFKPIYITTQAESAGFCELFRLILK